MDLAALIQNKYTGELNLTQQKILQRGGKFSSSEESDEEEKKRKLKKVKSTKAKNKSLFDKKSALKDIDSDGLSITEEIKVSDYFNIKVKFHQRLL